ncbi:MAG TPA: bifunctional riboflavin kinase/FAD synthetase [Pyrinomonadaceae bacterium]|nr:bifunctional riboflavin kinase/FAD synthetase [Pyrinomonadaceae bacterium]
MKLFRGTEDAAISRPTVVTLGVFDGLHIGHQLIMKTVVERARAAGTVPTVITFEPHPRAVLHPESAPPLLQTFDQKIEALGVLGIAQTIVIHFDKAFSQIRAEDFLREVVVDRLQAKEVYLGRGFAFGHNREGHIDLLRRVSGQLGFIADEVPEVQIRGARVSSSCIRELILLGQLNLARRMLGRPYGVQGSVVRGDARGQTLGFPTANIDPQNRVIPKSGVYVTAILIDGRWRQSVTNVGVRPTFGDATQSSIETHVLRWSGDLYERTVRVRFLHRLRSERKFGSIDELKTQIERDVARAGDYFERKSVKRSLAIT